MAALLRQRWLSSRDLRPPPRAVQARRARMSGAQVALDAVSDWLEGWFSSS